MSFEALAQTWGALLGVLLIGYAILDGFDLGVGILHPFVPRSDRDKRILSTRSARSGMATRSGS